EGDDFGVVRSAAEAAGAPVPDRETLPDPTWETFVVTNPRSVASSIASMSFPDPLISVETTPAGEVVQYIELSSPISGLPTGGFQGSREPPFDELATDAMLELSAEDRLAATDEERDAALAAASQFFARHEIADAGSPKSLYMREGRNRARLAYLTWE